MDATHPLRDPGPADRRSGRAGGPGAGVRAQQVGPGRRAGGRLQELIAESRAHAAAAARRAGGRPFGRDRPRIGSADAGGRQGARRVAHQGEDPRPQRLAAPGGASATRRRPSTAAAPSSSTCRRPRPGRRPSCCSPAAPPSCPRAYRRYLVNSLRESFDLPGTPIRLTVRGRRQPVRRAERGSGQGVPGPPAARARRQVLKATTLIGRPRVARARRVRR